MDEMLDDVAIVPPSLRTSFFGALRKVQSRLKADDEEEQRLDQAFERQWLEEFERLRTEYATKWNTCTHTADGFCGVLFHSSDVQQQTYLLSEYPTLMEAWREANATTAQYPAASIDRDACIEYTSVTVSGVPPQLVQTTPALHEVLSLLRTEFQWSTAAVEAFTRRLERDEGIWSCTELHAQLTKRRGAYAERAFQSRAYPRLSKSMLNALRTAAEARERRDENIKDLSMEPLHVNPQ